MISNYPVIDAIIIIAAIIFNMYSFIAIKDLTAYY